MESVVLPIDHGPLVPAPKFAGNPGKLEGWAFVPRSLPARAPLVVVLHGCTQNAAAYDQGSGWSKLAVEAGFAVLYPEQNRANNPNLCFNWFVPGDVTRGQGEVESIRQMIAAMVAAHNLDPARVFITGLSAGGAMTASMLATAPELFAGGAIIAGVAHGPAGTMDGGLGRVRGGALPDAAPTARMARAASTHAGPWPRLSVWHGSADSTVDAA
ncbi:MAG: PHB depolymerase family esterase, partial [Sandarakinorhabdus sp.]|nr:PHB depolymerase family esterase [Sandarakinorhabdus sp.]